MQTTGGVGLTPDLRRQAYRALFRAHREPDLIHAIRSATDGNYALGTNRFKEEVARMLGRRVTCGQAGRPTMARARNVVCPRFPENGNWSGRHRVFPPSHPVISPTSARSLLALVPGCLLEQ